MYFFFTYYSVFYSQAIQEQNFASVYVKLCSVDMYVTVADNETISFKDLIIKKCKSLFESGKSHIMESSNKLQDIDLCRDPVIYYNLYIDNIYMHINRSKLWRWIVAGDNWQRFFRLSETLMLFVFIYRNWRPRWGVRGLGECTSLWSP